MGRILGLGFIVTISFPTSWSSVWDSEKEFPVLSSWTPGDMSSLFCMTDSCSSLDISLFTFLVFKKDSLGEFFSSSSDIWKSFIFFLTRLSSVEVSENSPKETEIWTRRFQQCILNMWRLYSISLKSNYLQEEKGLEINQQSQISTNLFFNSWKHLT